jgi:superfamily I DNA/RNA helicase
LVAYLRLAHSPHDSPALVRILNTPPRRLRAVEHAFRKQPVPIGELAEWAHRPAGSSARAAVERLLALLEDIHSASRSSRPSEALELVLHRTGYATWLTSIEPGRGHLEHVESLRGLLAGAEAPDLATWLADLHLDEAEAATADDRAVPLLTIYASKGREWPVVFIAGCEGASC